MAGPAGGDLQTVAEVAGRAVPAVVHIRVDRGFVLDSALRELYQLHGVADIPRGRNVHEVTGSGVIVTPEGRVLTNHHVVEGASEVVVVLADKSRLTAAVLGSDPRTDIAVLQIASDGPFPFLPLGDSGAVQVGDPVVAVGSPFDFQSTVTFGVVSAKGRRGLKSREIQDYIQTDAAVNPGNSGGPLVDLAGEVVGLNTAIFAPGVDQNSGVSFAIPANMLHRVADDIVAKGSVSRPWLGLLAVGVDSVDGDATYQGAEITQVMPESPASAAGLRRGDVITRIDGEPLTSVGELRSYVLSRGIGHSLTVEVSRDGLPVELPVTTAAHREVRVELPEVLEPFWGWAGMLLVEPTDAIIGKLGVAADAGVVVADVEPDSHAAKIGINPGDMLVRVGGLPVLGLEPLRERVTRYPLDYAVVAVARAGGTVHAVLPRP